MDFNETGITEITRTNLFLIWATDDLMMTAFREFSEFEKWMMIEGVKVC